MQIKVGTVHIAEGRGAALVKAVEDGKKVGVKPAEVVEAILNEVSPYLFIQARSLGYTLEQMLAQPLFINQLFLSARINRGLSEREATEYLEEMYGDYGDQARPVYSYACKHGYNHASALAFGMMIEEMYATARRGNKAFVMAPAKFIMKLISYDNTISPNGMMQLWCTAVGSEYLGNLEFTDANIAALMGSELGVDADDVDELPSREDKASAAQAKKAAER